MGPSVKFVLAIKDKIFKKKWGSIFFPEKRPYLGGHSEASAPTQPDAVHNLIGMTALVMWPKLLYLVKLDNKVIF